MGKGKYFVTLYKFTAATLVVRFIHTKDQTGWPLKIMIVEQESVAANRVQVGRIRVDNGGEYIVKTLKIG